MPYGRRYRRHRARGGRLRRRSRRYPARRPKVSRKRSRSRFRKVPKSIKRAGRLACPVVYECLKKIAASNTTYNLMSCLGSKSCTVDKFATAVPMAITSGPFSGATGEAIEPCGYLGFNLYEDPTARDGIGLSRVTQHPASILYTGTPVDFHVFPLLAQTNPQVATAIFNENNCRTSSTANIISYDNRHKQVIIWPPIDSTSATGSTWDVVFKQKLIMHEIVWWVPDLTTIEDKFLVVTEGASNTCAETQTALRARNTWLRQMYNAYFVKRPVLDDGESAAPTTMLDIVDICTAGPAIGGDTYMEPTVDATPLLAIANDNMWPLQRTTIEYQLGGIQDRRKEAKPYWNRKRTFTRPMRDYFRAGTGVHEATATGVLSPGQHILISAGRKFNINKKMQWERVAADAVPDSSVREVCPRGCYVYVKYWYFMSGMQIGITLANTIRPGVSNVCPERPMKTNILKWQNV